MADITSRDTKRGFHTPVVHVGKPSSNFQQRDWVTTKVYFHDFEILSHPRDYFVESPTFNCLGHEWVLKLFPRGLDTEDDDTVAVLLVPRSHGAIEVEFGFLVENCATRGGKHTFNINGSCSSSIPGFDLLTRDMALTSLQNGALVIEVSMKPVTPFIPPFIPENPFACKAIQDMYMDKESADVMFEVGGHHTTTLPKTKRLKTVATKFYAHRFILIKAAPQLAELCMMSNESSPRIIIVPNIRSDTFEDMLRYIYGHRISMYESDCTRMYNIIEAANKYGVTNLKLEAEVEYVFLIENTFNIENFMEHLRNADAMSLAYLKEVVMDFVVENKVEIMEKNVLLNAPGGLLNDVLAAVARSEYKTGVAEWDDEVELRILGIHELRRRAHLIGLCVDGSREALIAAIESKSSAENGC